MEDLEYYNPSLKVDFLMIHENFCENNYILSDGNEGKIDGLFW